MQFSIQLSDACKLRRASAPVNRQSRVEAGGPGRSAGPAAETAVGPYGRPAAPRLAPLMLTDTQRAKPWYRPAAEQAEDPADAHQQFLRTWG
jgi:hypothetical protein